MTNKPMPQDGLQTNSDYSQETFRPNHISAMSHWGIYISHHLPSLASMYPTLLFVYFRHTLATPIWKCQEGSKNLQRIPTPWGLLGGQYKAFYAIFKILQCKNSETCPDFRDKSQFLC